MQKLFTGALIVALFTFQSTFAQKPQKPNAAEIYSKIQKLNFLGSVLYVAAHPDDENTRIISYLASEKKARTGYMSLTRGDGGQNLIGPELRELLGAIRTQELLEARKIDGGEQFFSRANDFGYSKNPSETLEIWDKEAVLSDLIFVIRKFQPDVIINRFDARSPGTTHGHHTASAMLSVEAFDKANDPKYFSKQLQLADIWQPKRLFFNTSWWFYGSKEKFEKADKTNMYNLQTGVFYQSIGKSNQEIAALSRSSHQSQGFGSTGTRGEDVEYLEFLKGDAPKNKSDIFEGIDTSWNRIKNGKTVGVILASVEKNFDFKNPSASIPELVKAYSALQLLNESHWKPIKSKEIIQIIADCSGLYLEAVAENPEITPGSLLNLKLEVINRSNVQMQLVSVQSLPKSEKTFASELSNNVLNIFESQLIIPENEEFTQPYWLKEQGSVGMYRVDDQKNIGIPDVIRDIKVTFNIKIEGVNLPFERNVIYKYNDDVKGEIYRPLDIIPAVTTSIQEKVTLFGNKKTQMVVVKIKAGKDAIKGDLILELPLTWKVIPKSANFSLSKKDEEQLFSFEVTAPESTTEITAKAVAIVDGKRFEKDKISITYDHISRQQILKPSEAKFINSEIKTGNEKIAYIMGAGDEVPKSLRQMGYSVTILKAEDITRERLLDFDVVMTGIRAYNTVNLLAFKQDLLFDYVKSGHTMIVQYNTSADLITDKIAPFILRVSRDRVTEENAEMTFPNPKNVILNYPNKITEQDFKAWKQEQGLYFPDQWDSAFTPILSSHDKGESAKKGALLVAKYGKGNYIYTGLSFFRELPEGVTGAFRLMANLISIPTEK